MPFEVIEPFLVIIPASPDRGKKVAKRPDWAVIEANNLDHDYYVGYQTTDPDGTRRCCIHNLPATTSHFAILVTGEDMAIFASMTLETLRPIKLKYIERKSLTTKFDPSKVTVVN